MRLATALPLGSRSLATSLGRSALTVPKQMSPAAVLGQLRLLQTSAPRMDIDSAAK